MAPKLRAQGTQAQSNAATPESPEAALLRNVRMSMESYLKGRRLVSLKIRQVEGRNIDGILKIEGAKGELQMLDFKATTGPHGGLSFLEIGERRISHGAFQDPEETR